jgi:hypothetical protein
MMVVSFAGFRLRIGGTRVFAEASFTEARNSISLNQEGISHDNIVFNLPASGTLSPATWF